MQSGRRHRFLLLMLCAFIVSLLMNAGMASSVRADADAWPGGATTLSLDAGMSDANAADTHGECRQIPADDVCGDDVTLVDDDWMLPAWQVASFRYVPPAVPSSLDVADIAVPVARLFRPPDFA
jgi:hypothetical protein